MRIRIYKPSYFALRDIRAGNEDGAFRVVQDGSLRTAKKFNHKLRDKYILQIRVFDNGTPPLFSDTYGTKNIFYFLFWKIC
jgi:protocadherin Fat 1/2/3